MTHTIIILALAHQNRLPAFVSRPGNSFELPHFFLLRRSDGLFLALKNYSVFHWLIFSGGNLVSFGRQLGCHTRNIGQD